MPYTEFHYTPTGTGVISGKEVLEQTEDAINDLGGQISGDVQTAIDTANNALNTANTASADAQNAVNTANTAYTAATNAQNTANTAQNTASNALTAAQNAQNDVNALENVVTGIDGRLTTTEGNVTNLNTRMGTAEGNITTLQNDVITAQGTATSAQNTATLARGQAYVVRYASVAVSDNSTVPYTDLNNIDNVKVNDLLLDINGKIYQISSVDTANETVSVTTPLTQLAVDSGVVHNSGNETIGGIKTFADIPVFSTFDGIRFRCAHNSNAYVTFRNVGQADPGSIIFSAHDGSTVTAVHLVNKTFVPYNNNDTDLGSSSKFWKDLYAYHGYIRGQQQNDEYSGNARTNLTLLANRDTLGQSGCLVDTFRENTSQGTGMHILGFGMRENSVRYEGLRVQWVYNSVNSGYDFNLKPNTQGTNKPLTYNLGTSADKWDTINGLNPGSLSLPDTDNDIDISGYITDLTGASNINLYSPPSDGYVGIVAKGDWIELYVRNEYGSTFHPSDSGYVMALLPVRKSADFRIAIKATQISFAKFYPCLGNV